MKRIRMILFFLPAIWFAGCVKESPTSVTQDLVVVRAYLYAGKPIDQIQLSRVLPLGSEETQMPPINDTQVSLIRQGTEYPLVPSAGDSGYYHDESGLNVQTGDGFTIRVLYKGQTVEGETTVPPAPENLTLSANTLALSEDSFGSFGGGFGAMDSTQTLTVTWTSETGALYYTVLENMETDTVAIDTLRRFGSGMRRTVSQPTDANEFRISRFDVSYWGRHRVTVYRVNQEYADLYTSRQQDSRDLNEPLTNIRNGLGVISAFNSGEVFFYVSRE
jgi:hypothetical protein